jgi:MoxR-like ATPase
MFNVVINYLPEDDEVAVVKQTTSAASAKIEPIFAAEDVIAFHDIVRRVPIAEDVIRYAVKLAAATRPREKGAIDFIQNWVNWGAGTRAGQYLVLGAKARALLAGRSHATFDDIRLLANPVLRHRILLNYRAEAEGITMEKLIADVIEKVPGGPRKG